MTAATAKQPAATLEVGDRAPAFSLPANGGNTASLSPTHHTVLYFYPKDDTPGCTTEAKDFKEHLPAFEAANATIIGVSKDSIKSHEQFREKYCLPFALASDEDGAVCEAYGVWGEKSMYGKIYMGIERTTFLIDKAGIIRNIWRKVKVDNHVKDVLAAVKGL